MDGDILNKVIYKKENNILIYEIFHRSTNIFTEINNHPNLNDSDINTIRFVKKFPNNKDIYIDNNNGPIEKEYSIDTYILNIIPFNIPNTVKHIEFISSMEDMWLIKNVEEIDKNVITMKFVNCNIISGISFINRNIMIEFENCVIDNVFEFYIDDMYTSKSSIFINNTTINCNKLNLNNINSVSMNNVEINSIDNILKVFKINNVRELTFSVIKIHLIETITFKNIDTLEISMCDIEFKDKNLYVPSLLFINVGDGKLINSKNIYNLSLIDNKSFTLGNITLKNIIYKNYRWFTTVTGSKTNVTISNLNVENISNNIITSGGIIEGSIVISNSTFKNINNTVINSNGVESTIVTNNIFDSCAEAININNNINTKIISNIFNKCDKDISISNVSNCIISNNKNSNKSIQKYNTIVNIKYVNNELVTNETEINDCESIDIIDNNVVNTFLSINKANRVNISGINTTIYKFDIDTINELNIKSVTVTGTKLNIMNTNRLTISNSTIMSSLNLDKIGNFKNETCIENNTIDGDIIISNSFLTLIRKNNIISKHIQLIKTTGVIIYDNVYVDKTTISSLKYTKSENKLNLNFIVHNKFTDNLKLSSTSMLPYVVYVYNKKLYNKMRFKELPIPDINEEFLTSINDNIILPFDEDDPEYSFLFTKIYNYIKQTIYNLYQ